jgi:hypothetical protein
MVEYSRELGMRQYKMGGSGTGGLGFVQELNRRFDTPGELYSTDDSYKISILDDMTTKGLVEYIGTEIEFEKEQADVNEQNIIKLFNELNNTGFIKLRSICRDMGISYSNSNKKSELIEKIMRSL